MFFIYIVEKKKEKNMDRELSQGVPKIYRDGVSYQKEKRPSILSYSQIKVALLYILLLFRKIPPDDKGYPL